MALKCILPFIHQDIHHDGNVFVCCRVLGNSPVGNVRSDSPDEIWNNKILKEIRKLAVKDEWHDHCQRCKADEKMETPSLRQLYNTKYSDLDSIHLKMEEDGKMPLNGIHYVSIKFSNLCNLQCMYCDYNYSSSWAPKGIKPLIQTPYIEGNENLINYIGNNLDTLKEIHCGGGEPLIDPRHDELLDFLIAKNKTDIKITYNTNLTKIKNGKLIDSWKKFKEISISASIDDFGKRFEYIRNGANWNGVTKNITLLQSNNIKFNLFMTITNLNVYFIPEFIRHMQTDFGIDYNQIQLNTLVTPERFNISSMSKEYTDKVVKKLQIFRKELLLKQYAHSDTATLILYIKGIIKKLNEAREEVSGFNENFVQDILSHETEDRKLQFKMAYPHLS
jgi:MoaA/NifB/PqqE/SkfB family radical SAM enzyme